MLPNSLFIPLEGNAQETNKQSSNLRKILPVTITPPFHLLPTIFINAPVGPTISPNMIMNPPVIPAKLNSMMTTTSAISGVSGTPSTNSVNINNLVRTATSAMPINLEEYHNHMPIKVLNEFQKEIVKVLDKPQQMFSPITNITDIPQHLEVKVRFVTEAEMLKIEMERLNWALAEKAQQASKKIETENALNAHKNPTVNKLEKEQYIDSVLRIPRCHKSIQCNLLKEEVKVEKVKKINEEKSKYVSVDKCISTEDYDLDLDFIYVAPADPAKERLFKYLKDGNCECIKCGKVCKSGGHMERHVQQHREKSLLCCKCGKICKNTIACTHHEMYCGRNRIEYRKAERIARTCQHCGRVSKSKIEHLDHLNSHTGEKPHKCSCGARFGHVSNLRDHHKRFGCDVSFRDTIYGIRMKSRTVRLKETNKIAIKDLSVPLKHCSKRKDPDRYLCKVCNLRCRDYTHFRSHRLKHITERKFICKTCNNCYKDTHSLRIHIKLKHLSKIQCNICEKKISTPHMTKHMRMHTGEKPFVCDVCEEGFASRKSLTGHKFEIHNIGTLKVSEKTVYKCYLCKQTFCVGRSLRRHLLKEIHCEKEEKWREKFSISTFSCTYCTKEDFRCFADYAAHAGKTHNMHIYSKMEVIFQEFEKLENSNLTEDVKIESNEIEDTKPECNHDVEGLELDSINLNEERKIIKEETEENVENMEETIKKELILEEFMDKFTSNTKEEGIDIKFEEMEILDEFLNSLPKDNGEVCKENN